MADKKISELTALGGQPAGADLLPIVDDTDSTTKKVTYTNLITGLTTPSSTDTFTNKTFNANGTGNSLSNVDVADLSNGTDGELITWDTDGTATTVGVGTSGQYLTSQGAGAKPVFVTGSTGGAWTHINTHTTGSAVAKVSVSGLTTTDYDWVVVLLSNMDMGSNAIVECTVNAHTSAYEWQLSKAYAGTAAGAAGSADTDFQITQGSANKHTGIIWISNTSGNTRGGHYQAGGEENYNTGHWENNDTNQMTSIEFFPQSGNINTGFRVDVFGITSS